MHALRRQSNARDTARADTMFAPAQAPGQPGANKLLVVRVGLASPPGRDRRRDSARHAMLLSCQLTAGATTVAGQIHDISDEGAMLTFGRQLAPIIGEPVRLALGDGRTVWGHIRWVADGFAGISFFEIFPVEELVELPRVDVAGERR